MLAPCQETTTPSRTEVDRASEAELGRALEIFQSQRTALFRMAYRVLGDVSGAEDVVQEAWLRWQRTDRMAIKNPAAFLITTTTRLAINVIQSARHRHETPTESPLAAGIDPALDPCSRAEEAAVVEQALGHLMARLTPAELGAYLLRKGFDYPYCDIAAVLQTSEPNARQLVRRAQIRIEGDQKRAVHPKEHRHLVTAFLTAARIGDMGTLERLVEQPAPPCWRRADDDDLPDRLVADLVRGGRRVHRGGVPEMGPSGRRGDLPVDDGNDRMSSDVVDA